MMPGMMSRLMPAGMIFILNKGGIIQSIYKHASPKNVEEGANIWLNAVVRLAER